MFSMHTFLSTNEIRWKWAEHKFLPTRFASRIQHRLKSFGDLLNVFFFFSLYPSILKFDVFNAHVSFY